MEYILEYLLELLLCLPAVLVALTFHEVAHGFVAYKLGDPTAKHMGRLTLNPIKHIDPIGAFCMLFLRFGWAKPVPINTRFFKKPKRDMALTALAGPLSNLILAFFGCFVYSLTLRFLPGFTHESFSYWLAFVWVNIVYYFAWLNISLAIFNLIPLPPLDGSRIFLSMLPERQYFKVMRYEREIAVGFMLVLLLDSRLLGGYITGALSFVVNLIFNGMMSFYGLFL